MLRGQKGESVPLGSSDEGERRLTKESHQRLGSLHGQRAQCPCNPEEPVPPRRRGCQRASRKRGHFRDPTRATVTPDIQGQLGFVALCLSAFNMARKRTFSVFCNPLDLTPTHTRKISMGLFSQIGVQGKEVPKEIQKKLRDGRRGGSLAEVTSTVPSCAAPAHREQDTEGLGLPAGHSVGGTTECEHLYQGDCWWGGQRGNPFQHQYLCCEKSGSARLPRTAADLCV